MGSKSKTGKSRIIQFVDLQLPANFKPAKIDKAWDYTCRVWDRI
ncbi:MAG: hypothetical protein WC905_03395 [Patescibacteria group bacterium]|jgi:hypothetical protein